MKRISLFTYAILIILNFWAIHSAYGAHFASDIDLLSPLNARTVKVLGDNSDDRIGYSTASGDIDGDGIDDLIT